MTSAWSAARASVPSAAEGVTDETSLDAPATERRLASAAEGVADETSLAAAATERRRASAVEANEALEDSRSVCALSSQISQMNRSARHPTKNPTRAASACGEPPHPRCVKAPASTQSSRKRQTKLGSTQHARRTVHSAARASLMLLVLTSMSSSRLRYARSS